MNVVDKLTSPSKQNKSTILKKKYCIAIEWVIDIHRGSILFIERYVVI